MESNRLTEHAQSLLGSVKRENPRGMGKLGNELPISSTNETTKKTEGFSFAKGVFHGADMPFSKAIGLKVVQAWSGMSDTIYMSWYVPGLQFPTPCRVDESVCFCPHALSKGPLSMPGACAWIPAKKSMTSLGHYVVMLDIIWWCSSNIGYLGWWHLHQYWRGIKGRMHGREGVPSCDFIE